MMMRQFLGVLKAFQDVLCQASFAAICGLLVACQAIPRTLPDALGKSTAWQAGEATIADTPIAYAQRAGVGPWRVYVEGDGNAFTAQGRPSPNPTPWQPVGLQLAQADTSGAPVLYLGRPCQWVSLTAVCQPPVWTTQRFSPQVLADYTRVIGQLTQGQPAEIIGFSGGAWVAYGVAQQLPALTRVVTVAGNLNPNLINQYHRVPEMVVAPWPPRRQDLPLIMLWGAHDTTIPPKLAAALAAGLPAGCNYSQTIPDTTHVKGWVAWWAQTDRVAIPTRCLNEYRAPLSP